MSVFLKGDGSPAEPFLLVCSGKYAIIYLNKNLGQKGDGGMAELSGDRRLLEIFRQYGTLKKYNPGQLLVENGQRAAYSCYLVSGYARTFCINSNGDDITLFYIEPDNLICSESLLLDATVQVSVEAIAPAEMYLLPGSELLRLWSERGWGVQELMRPLVERLTLLSDYICCAHFRENNKKVAYFLHSCYMRIGETIPYTNEQIAEITGINRVSVNRILNALAKDGVVELGYKKIQIRKPQALKEIFGTVGYFIDD